MRLRVNDQENGVKIDYTVHVASIGCYIQRLGQRHKFRIQFMQVVNSLMMLQMINDRTGASVFVQEVAV